VATRARLLSAEPLCRHCMARGVTACATQIDHIQALINGGMDTDENKQPLCADCHRIKTDADMGRRSRTQIGADGYPVGGGRVESLRETNGKP
jgi:5-methylcytosine-specific restriction protein A